MPSSYLRGRRETKISSLPEATPALAGAILAARGGPRVWNRDVSVVERVLDDRQFGENGGAHGLHTSATPGSSPAGSLSWPWGAARANVSSRHAQPCRVLSAPGYRHSARASLDKTEMT